MNNILSRATEIVNKSLISEQINGGKDCIVIILVAVIYFSSTRVSV